MDEARKAQGQIEQLTNDLASERSNSQKLEYNKMILGRQNKELRAKLQDLETSQETRTRSTIAVLAAKVSQIEEHLEMEPDEHYVMRPNKTS
ncbi:hypothetical protein NPIL_488861 [Nephila pilipes]|uniref:Myosin tail domain-containing protein n=1 Tax=Nephila pilipes TaxID=299642 RepID=A0A8X6IL48_NEPPI|nr:hypothetical protein NPIL_488861 [Nephila pilipes]